MTRVLVIGASGLLGTEIAATLRRRQDIAVVPTSRRRREGWLEFDADGGAEAVARLLDEAGDPAVVINSAGLLAHEIDARSPESLRLAERVNAEFPRELARETRRRGIRMIHVSTDAVFRADAGRSFEDDEAFAEDAYGSTKRRGEPDEDNTLVLRCTFVGRDRERRRGLLEWLLGRPPGTSVDGYVDQLWNGLAAAQVAAVCAAAIDPALFARARSEGAVHHLYEDPPLTKHALLVLICGAFGLDVHVAPRESGMPVTRTLGTRHVVLRQTLESAPPRAAMLEALAVTSPDP